MKHPKRTIDFTDKIIIFTLYDKLTDIKIEIDSKNQTFREVLRDIEEELHMKDYGRYEVVDVLSSILGFKYQPTTRITGEGENGNTLVLEVLDYNGEEFMSSVLIEK